MGTPGLIALCRLLGFGESVGVEGCRLWGLTISGVGHCPFFHFDNRLLFSLSLFRCLLVAESRQIQRDGLVQPGLHD